VDNRFATVTLSAPSGLKGRDKISYAGVKFLGQMAKNVLPQDATFSLVAVLHGTHLEITPKAVALDDVSL
ncbi:P22 phage major capsid protein family protein, partial [Salmonella enterica]|uniref:P22 phage major capsid protein family protein n=1 Tax=Salmonella enterica TaxID=28901 RepID=UPI003299EE4C